MDEINQQKDPFQFILVKKLGSVHKTKKSYIFIFSILLITQTIHTFVQLVCQVFKIYVMVVFHEEKYASQGEGCKLWNCLSFLGLLGCHILFRHIVFNYLIFYFGKTNYGQPNCRLGDTFRKFRQASAHKLNFD